MVPHHVPPLIERDLHGKRTMIHSIDFDRHLARPIELEHSLSFADAELRIHTRRTIECSPQL